MKTKISLFTLLLFLLLLFKSSFSQEMPNVHVTNDRYLGNNTANYNDVSGVNVVKEKSQKQTDLENEIYRLKRTDNPFYRGRIEQLNRQLGTETGNFSTKMTPYYGGGIEYAGIPNPNYSTDNITNNLLYNNSARTIKGIATFTEQRGANEGRLWVVYAFSANSSSPDSLRFIYSNNGGSTWTLYALAWLGGTDKINYDDLDMEIIESSSGDKYLWTVYGLRQTGGNGKWFSGGAVLDITTFAGGLFAFSWPGDDPAKRYYNVRMTSDNANFYSNSWTYIVCSFDSTDASNIHINTQKYVRCLNPYTTSPAFEYQGQKFWWYCSNGPAGYVRTLYSDIAYIRGSAGDSIIVSFSGVPDSTRIFFSKANLNGTPAVGNASSQAGSEATAFKRWARIASNGYDNGSVLCVFNEIYSFNWNVKYFRTTNYGNFNSVFESTLWGSNANSNYQPDIVGVRNADRYYFAFSTIASSDSVHYVGVTPSGGTTHIQKMNYMGITSGTQGPKPGFRFVNNDSCFVLYSESGPYNVWAALGCSGPIVIGIHNNNNEIPASYALYQNYPNPFNPASTIKFDIPKTGLARLVVYDVLGREVGLLLNEIKTPGTYSLNFDASNLPSGVYFYRLTAGTFTDTKKMLLLK
jgi:hypothetical protein